MTEKILQSLEIMGWGMLGIFIVVGVIIGVTYLLNVLTNVKPKKRKNKNNQQN